MSMERQEDREPRDGSDREAAELAVQRRMRDVACKLLVLSGKGGVGKSTVAANLAMSLGLAGKAVGLLDVDLHGPSIPQILGLGGQRLGPHPSGAIEPIRLTENVRVVSIGLLLESAEEAVIWRGPMKYGVIRQFLSDVAWGPLDYLIIDSPPGTGDEPLTIAQLAGEGSWAVVVTTPQDLAVSDVRRCLSFCKRLSLPVAGVVENMSGMVCPHCGARVDLFGAGGGRRLAEQMKVPFLGRIPIDPEIVASGDCGKPLVRHYAGSHAAVAFAEIVDRMLNRIQYAKTAVSSERGTENKSMKIAIPTVDGKLCPHFGHCERFAIVEVDESTKTVLRTDYLPPPAHEPGALPRWLQQQGAGVVIVGGMGRRAQQLFAQSGIGVVVGAPADAPEQIASAYLDGSLKTGRNICDH